MWSTDLKAKKCLSPPCHHILEEVPEKPPYRLDPPSSPHALCSRKDGSTMRRRPPADSVTPVLIHCSQFYLHLYSGFFYFIKRRRIPCQLGIILHFLISVSAFGVFSSFLIQPQSHLYPSSFCQICGTSHLTTYYWRAYLLFEKYRPNQWVDSYLMPWPILSSSPPTGLHFDSLQMGRMLSPFH